ncbi:MAG: exonuclease SbcCD subunit D [Clostridiales bacterium]|nr:exonuclease SbcCD subunit D [Clostridiales bacterium]
MRCIHISDLHLGKQFKEHSLCEDQEFVLDKICGICEDEKIDALLIAGDIYQTSTPSAEAMKLFDTFLDRICGLGIKVFMISGNHDSDIRISYFSSLIEKAGIFTSRAFDGKLQSIVYPGQENVVIHLIPYLKPIHVRKFYPDEKIDTYQDAMEVVLKNSPLDKSKTNILLCHQFITGALTSDSEELVIGGLDNIDYTVFSEFDYVALGHIHRPQHIGRKEVRYSGSILKYSFSEAHFEKSCTLLDISEDGKIEISTIPLPNLHEVREVSGMYDELINLPISYDYVSVTIHDENATPDAVYNLRSVFPNMLSFRIENAKTAVDVDIEKLDEIDKKTPVELFSDFYRSQNGNVEMTKEQMNIITTIAEGLEGTDL